LWFFPLFTLDVLFYFFPTENGDLCSFLVGLDVWYSQHIATLSTALFNLYPLYQTKDATQQTQADNQKSQPQQVQQKVMSPGRILRSELERYFRIATWPLNMNLYQCTCWSFKKKLIVTRVFFSRAEIGFTAYCAQFRKKSREKFNRQDQLNEEDLQKDKNFKYLGANLNIKFNQKNIENIERTGPKLEPKVYHQVTFFIFLI